MNIITQNDSDQSMKNCEYNPGFLPIIDDGEFALAFKSRCNEHNLKIYTFLFNDALILVSQLYQFLIEPFK